MCLTLEYIINEGFGYGNDRIEKWFAISRIKIKIMYLLTTCQHHSINVIENFYWFPLFSHIMKLGQINAFDIMFCYKKVVKRITRSIKKTNKLYLDYLSFVLRLCIKKRKKKKLMPQVRTIYLLLATNSSQMKSYCFFLPVCCLMTSRKFYSRYKCCLIYIKLIRILNGK